MLICRGYGLVRRFCEDQATEYWDSGHPISLHVSSKLRPVLKKMQRSD